MSNHKQLPFIFFFVAFGMLVFAQQKSERDIMNEIKEYDISKVIFPDSISEDGIEYFARKEPLGFIDTTYQRFQIHFSSIQKSKHNPYLYQLKGKTKIDTTICSFTGTLKIVAAGISDSSARMIDIGAVSYKEGFVLCEVCIYQDKACPGAGYIKGNLSTSVVMDTNEVLSYDAFLIVADGYSNNGFEGQCTSYKTHISKICNWGDYRIPNCGDLDFGTGEFSVNPKYINNGWRTFYLADSGNKQENKEAKRQENSHWWK